MIEKIHEAITNELLLYDPDLTTRRAAYVASSIMQRVARDLNVASEWRFVVQVMADYHHDQGQAMMSGIIEHVQHPPQTTS